jgi:hypothetical protein
MLNGMNNQFNLLLEQMVALADKLRAAVHE